ncbi:PTS transporter subunit EIIC [Catenulispora yoronensis]|uniref:PTS transporter subunit EIIC n=2 Tax=Catenulispora yoronensis TaxID=450799 RepID=A0ABP5H7P0_9ACTN
MSADAAVAAPKQPGWGSKTFAVLQRIGKSLMLPIATLPVAGLLVRFGQDDMLGRFSSTFLRNVAAIMATGGNALLGNLPIIFAIGVAIGFAKKSDGTTAVAAIVGYLVYHAVSMQMFFGSKLKDQVQGLVIKNAEQGVNQAVPAGGLKFGLDMTKPNPTGVLGGILVGIMAALLWQRYYKIKLPSWLAFFGGRRFVPIVTALACLFLGVVMGWIWSPIGQGINDLSNWITRNSSVGLFIYGTVNRSLIPFGLHHILNAFPWFQFGSYTTATGTFHGDSARFLNGDPTAGLFMTGFYPIMMFGLPGAALAMWRSALPTKRKVAGSILISAALTSFVTGVTEPLEFAFMFVAPALYAIHAVLTGISMSLMWALGCKDAFNFSAGLIDFVLNWGRATKPWLILIVGPIYFVVYYGLFRFAIKTLDLRTPGREPDPETDDLAIT